MLVWILVGCISSQAQKVNNKNFTLLYLHLIFPSFLCKLPIFEAAELPNILIEVLVPEAGNIVGALYHKL